MRILKGVCLGVLFLAGCFAVRIQRESGLRGKEILKWGWDTPRTDYVRKHWREMDAKPVDGVVYDLEVTKPRTSEVVGHFAWLCWSKRRIRREELEWAVQNLKQAKFKRLRSFFIRFNVSPGTIGWFEDFHPVLHNIKLATSIAKELGFRGILLDVEQYSGSVVFNYQAQKKLYTASFRQYQRKVRQGGMEFGRSASEGMRGVEIILTFGHDLAFRQVGQHHPLEEISYALLPAFLDGVLEGLDDSALLINGYEASYGFDRESQFRSAVKTVKEGMLKYTLVPQLYRKKVRIAFALWLDYGGKVWDAVDTSKNYFSPDRFAWALHLALKYSDHYVWVYSHKPNFWTGRKMSEDYYSAFLRARSGKPQKPVNRGDRAQIASPRTAKQYPGYSEEETFREIFKKYEKIGELPRKWFFRIDPKEVGEKRKWFRQELSEKGWKTVEIGEWWEPQGYDYDGYAWYRVRAEVPELPQDRKIFIGFGAVDESAWVYTNGKLLYTHDLGESGWNKPFLVDVTDYIKGQRTIHITVRVFDRILKGGIWKKVLWLAEKK